MRDAPTFSEHDTKLSLWLSDPNDPAMESIRNALIKHLRTRLFSIGIDPKIRKHYRCISRDFHAGRKAALEVKVRRGGRHLEIEFFQNVVFENPSGGEFDFSRRQKMPYLIGKQYEVEVRHIAELLRTFGHELIRDRTQRGIAYIRDQQQRLTAFQGAGFYDRPIPAYNRTSAAGRRVAPGDEVYAILNGRIHRGIAHANINNMWWFLLPCGTVRNMASFELYHRADLQNLKGRHFLAADIERRLRRVLAAQVAAEAFERAVQLRDTIRRRFLKPAAAAAPCEVH
jgi:hypothetical protein